MDLLLVNFFKEHNVPVATDVHVLTNVYDDYNQKYMRSADILFLSNEGCKDKEAEFLREIYNIYHNKIIVIGCGHEGALAYQGEYDKFFYEPAVAPYGVKNTVGSGDALFTSFIHYYIKTKEADTSPPSAFLVKSTAKNFKKESTNINKMQII